MKNKIRKAFTLVELLVVIAILAVLATMGIVGYTSFTKKAKESNDRSVISQLNLALSATETTEGKPKTMHEALKVVESAGFVVANLTPDSEGYDYIYDMENNRFALINKEGATVAQASDKDFSPETNKVSKWLIAHNANDLTRRGYSIYLADDYSGATSLDTLRTGLDCGNKTDIDSITYLGATSGSQKVVIRTNGGNLTIDAVNDTVKHYGSLEGLNIIAVASTSYHENGNAGFVNIKQGRLVIEENAEIDGIYLQDTNGTFNGIKLAVVGTAELPSIARSDVAMNDGDKQVLVEIQNIASSDATDGTPEYVWLENNAGTISTVISSSSTSSTEAVAQPSTAANEVKTETAESAAPIDENSQARIGAVGYATLVDAVTAVNSSANGGTIVILKDIDFSTSTYSSYKWYNDYNPLEITSSNVTLDLNGHTFDNMGNVAICFGHILAADGRIANCAIKNGSLKVGAHETDPGLRSYAFAVAGVDGMLIEDLSVLGGINIYSGSNDVVIKNCQVEGCRYYTVCVQSGSHAEIIGGTFTKRTDSSVANKSMFWTQGSGTDGDMVTTENPTGAFEASSIILRSGNFNVNDVDGKFNLLGKDYAVVTVCGGTFNFDPTSVVADGYSAVNNGNGTWTVKADN